MAVDVISSDRNGSFQNPPDEIPTSSCSKRHASKAASSAWTELKKRKSPRSRGDLLAGVVQYMRNARIFVSESVRSGKH